MPRMIYKDKKEEDMEEGIKEEPGSSGFPQGGSDAWKTQQILNTLVHVLLPAPLLPVLLLVLPAVVLLVHLLGRVASLAAAALVVQLVGVLVIELVQGLGHEQGGGVRLLQLGQEVLQV